MGARDSVKANTMPRDEIEFFSEIRQRFLRIDSRNDAANVEQLGCTAEERFVVRVEAESLVTEEPAEVEKIARAATKIENVQWWHAIEPKVLDTLRVDADPVVCVFIRVDFPRIGPIRITFAQAL